MRIVIVGGGLVGASLALCLQAVAKQRSWQIDIIEPYPLEGDYQPSYDGRSSAITYGSSLLYQQLGIWPALLTQAAAITDIHIFERAHLPTVHLAAAQEGVPALGYVIENGWLGQCLLQQLDTAIVRFHTLTVEQLSACEGGYTVVLSDGMQLHADLVVLADGGRSALRQQLGIAVKQSDYQQSAIVANVLPSYRHNGRAFECFTQQGPLALLPRADYRCALIWTQPIAETERLLALSDEAFLAALQRSFGDTLGVFKQVGARASYHLSLTQAMEQVRPHLVLLGSSAHSLHPVAGQGYNLSLRDAWHLAHALINTDKPLGDLSVLQQYVAQRLKDQKAVTLFSDQLVKLFGAQNPVLKFGRRLGLMGLSQSPFMKHWLVRQAMGLGVNQ